MTLETKIFILHRISYSKEDKTKNSANTIYFFVDDFTNSYLTIDFICNIYTYTTDSL